MIFTLEVLQAKYGDCLILHFGTPDNHQLMIIDGGPAGVYRDVLKPRLLQLKAQLSPHDPLPISMVMVSHMDDDHVNGIVALTNDMVDYLDQEKDPPFQLDYFWFNTFDDIINNLQIPKLSAVAAAASVASVEQLPGIGNVDASVAAVIASTQQGRDLRNNVTARLNASLNEPFVNEDDTPGFVRGDIDNLPIDWDDLSIQVLHPNEQRLEEYQAKWDEDLRKYHDKGDPGIIIAALADKDKSPFNLSSIVCLVSYGGKKILLTGDSRSDDFYNGLQENGLLDEKGKLHVDIIKMAHHGSKNNATQSVYEKITADHYVVSANGKYDNPDQELLDMLRETLADSTIYFTNRNGENDLANKMNNFDEALAAAGTGVATVYREDDKLSLFIHLGEKF
ncbi:hypothetical protein KTO58_14970 [Chitinophaga pendula]|uniref:ComEC/Rec2 family competence protein n=1 Tax=Chitinophaga TaxID=79328 RepID=UPI000BB0BB94|nr:MULTISPECIES: hypothetical protein [Chitinophaga]ASZ11971.1 hypothetical protein CK934_13880 [Chitinophaga sp. MD30]UCJ04999.1 hypothetical protein KTO58_14970 [Chitinophaga pendula]